MIDLRKKSSLEQDEAIPTLRQDGLAAVWTAAEYEQHERSTGWLVGAGGVALVLVIAGIFLKSYFFVAFIGLAYGIFLAYQRRAPSQIKFSITSKGVMVGSEFHEYADLQSFWIFDAANELSLATHKRLNPYLRIPLGDANPRKVKNILQEHLPEEEHKEYISDKIARNI